MTDDELDKLRSVYKRRTAGTRRKEKGKHWEQQHDCEDASGQRYRVFVRWNGELSFIFSVGLTLLRDGQDDLVLCRYNGSHHGHRNRLENTRFAAGFHIHTARANYIAAGMDPDGFAAATDRYTTVEGALRCLVADCNIHGVLQEGSSPNLDLFER